ncbi:competence protein ComEA [Chitinivorax tropicus]|uniref:Competence protein ComEA n=1 Tax=Chitinivorax tropicus TaxID=714531 RepID=A0A840MSH2_9PROT|nr:helix-hairpin-helix domain-containing protein [Chitinivorax tropicus]MBB5019233.1 competence protein ComEA [Chitinivorax tropicus]
MKSVLIALLTWLAMMAGAWAAVDLNAASQQQLEALPGIGPAKAKAIIEYRTKNGPFKAPEDVMKVSGIKQGTFDKIKGELTVGGKGPAPAAKPAEAKAGAKPAEPKKEEKKK